MIRIEMERMRARLIFFLLLIMITALAFVPFIPGIKEMAIVNLNIDARHANGVDQVQVRLLRLRSISLILINLPEVRAYDFLSSSHTNGRRPMRSLLAL